MPGTAAREPVVLLLDPDAVYGADLIDYYFVEHGLRSVLGFTEKNARRIAFADVPQDGTWGEAERIFAIMARRMVVAERRAAALEAQVADLQTQLATALAGGHL